MQENSKTETIIGFLISSLGDKEFCINIKYINAILTQTEIEKGMIFGSLKDFSIYFKGNIVPILDINSFFNFKEKGHTDSTRLLILEYDSFMFAFLVEAVKEIISINNKNIREVKMLPNKDLKNFIADIINYDGRNFIIPDFKKILQEYFSRSNHPLIINN